MFVSRGMGEAFEGGEWENLIPGGGGEVVSREGEERLTMLTLPVC